MKISIKTRGVVVGILSLAFIGASATAASAATPSGSEDPIYFINGDTAETIAEGATIPWELGVIASPTTSPDDRFQGSDDADQVKVFLAPQGSERDISAWIAWGDSGFVSGTKQVWLPQLSPASLTAGNSASAKASGGPFSLGFAYTKNNGVTIADGGVVFTHIQITAGTGDFKYDYASGTVTPPVDPCAADPAACLTGEIALEATTIAAQDGALALSVPAGSKATFGAAVLVNQLSTSTTTLPEFTVSDSRIVSKKGWTLTSTVADFVSGTNTIEAKNLGVAPKVVAAGTTSTGVTTGTAQVAGSATTTAAPFAEAAAGAGLGDTKLSADLKLVAPATAAAGTYTSKMTLTLVSK
ncbi:hypothetical protein WJX64_14555 [Leifsonia sp. YIM 134122]|uniref:WxL domain-containing protein n=1 Tax=Leifsonia stereocauli TaxID=3134136 RepID=A0ABU9W6Z6_9MICO